VFKGCAFKTRSGESRVRDQFAFLVERGVSFEAQVCDILQRRPYPYPNHRVKEISQGRYKLSFQEWRIIYEIEGNSVTLFELLSGYSDEECPSIHRLFKEAF
jgi:hypothetical protein